MTALSGESPGPYVPRVVFDRLSPNEQEEVLDRVLRFVLRTYNASVVLKTYEEKFSFANLSIALMLRYESCEYLSDAKGIKTLVSLAVDKARYLYMEAKRKYQNDLEKGREQIGRPEEYNDDSVKHQESLSKDDQPSSEIDAEQSRRLCAWFRAKTQQGNKYHQGTRENLIRVIDLIFDPNADRPLYNFVAGRLSLRAGPIADVLGWHDPNAVSKLGEKLNEMLQHARGGNPAEKSSL